MFSLQLVEFTDREFLFVVDDALDEQGFATSAEIQAVLQLEHPRATACIGSRMAWLRRLGAVTFDPQAPRNALTRWTITDEGRLFMNGDLSKGQQSAMDAIRTNPAQTLTVLRQLRMEFEEADVLTAGLLRREWTHGIQRRKLRGN